MSESIRTGIQAAHNIQLARFADIESSNIVANADTHVGEIRSSASYRMKFKV